MNEGRALILRSRIKWDQRLAGAYLKAVRRNGHINDLPKFFSILDNWNFDIFPD